MVILLILYVLTTRLRCNETSIVAGSDRALRANGSIINTSNATKSNASTIDVAASSAHAVRDDVSTVSEAISEKNIKFIQIIPDKLVDSH